MTLFRLVQSRQPTGPTTLNLARTIPDDIKEPAEPISFQNKFLHQLDLLHKRTDAKLRTSRERYSCHLNRTVQGTPLEQMPESACMKNAPITKLLSNITGPFKIISVTPDNIKVNENGIHSTVSVDRVPLAPGDTKIVRYQKRIIVKMKTEPTKAVNW